MRKISGISAVNPTISLFVAGYMSKQVSIRIQIEIIEEHEAGTCSGL